MDLTCLQISLVIILLFYLIYYLILIIIFLHSVFALCVFYNVFFFHFTIFSHILENIIIFKILYAYFI